jgi:hypothetical protein
MNLSKNLTDTLYICAGRRSKYGFEGAGGNFFREKLHREIEKA